MNQFQKKEPYEIHESSLEIWNVNDKNRSTINEEKKPCQILVQCEEICSTESQNNILSDNL